MEIWLRGSFFSPGHNTSLSVTNDIEAVLRKIEYWNQGSIVGLKILYHDEQGVLDGVWWDGQRAVFFALGETDEKMAMGKLRGAAPAQGD